MKTYQIYIDSASAINAATGGSQRQYKFDWNILPEGEYEMSFTFMSQIQKLTNAEAEALTYPIEIAIEVPFTRNNYQVTTTGFAGSTNLAGVLEIKDQHKTSSHTMRLLVADLATNAPVSLSGRPQGLDFQVSLFAHTGIVPANDPNYNMVINLKHLC
tara:strand:- start:2405 stop:2878 length:474 start_codon:yes stop_codon:yes gene_type:complete